MLFLKVFFASLATLPYVLFVGLREADLRYDYSDPIIKTASREQVT